MLFCGPQKTLQSPVSVAFDQLPGDLEATRGCAPFSVIGARKADGWRGAIEVRRALDAAEMRALAIELNRMADLFDERVDW